LNAEIRFAHLSDWHATTLVGGGLDRFRGKRISGWASWRLNRHRHHSPRILEAAFRDVHAQGLDRILVTGDLTHISLESEFRAAAEQLRELGTPEQVFLVPGNHDCYVKAPASVSWDYWSAYLSGDDTASLDPELSECLVSAPEGTSAPRYEDYPTLRITGRLATIGLCSSIPTRIFRAGGELGAEQLRRLEQLLLLLGKRGFCRVVMIHHPVAAKGEPVRRALWDGAELRGVLARAGAELVVHGHKHRRRIHRVPGPAGDVPIIGVPSSSEVGSKPDKHAQYHIYTAFDDGTEGAPRYRIDAEIRGYDASSGEYQAVDESIF
jgi:3',5'-cyclic AMP phosphodiesterase CpdA